MRRPPTTKVYVCDSCGTLLEEGEDHCRRCGADRSRATQHELRDLCVTYTGDEPEVDEIGREVKPIFEPRWGQVQWYELSDAERRGKRKKRP